MRYNPGICSREEEHYEKHSGKISQVQVRTWHFQNTEITASWPRYLDEINHERRHAATSYTFFNAFLLFTDVQITLLFFVFIY